MSAPRRRFGRDQKTTILKRYLVDKVPISDLCDEYGIKPNQIYTWQKILFDHAELMEENVRANKSNRELGTDVGFPTPPATASWPRRGKGGKPDARRHAFGRLPDGKKQATMNDDLGGGCAAKLADWLAGESPADAGSPVAL